MAKDQRFASWLKSSRERKGWTTAILAENSGITQPYVTMLENGTRFPSRDVVDNIAAALGIDSAPGLLAAGFASDEPIESQQEEGERVRLPNGGWYVRPADVKEGDPIDRMLYQFVEEESAKRTRTEV